MRKTAEDVSYRKGQIHVKSYHPPKTSIFVKGQPHVIWVPKTKTVFKQFQPKGIRIACVFEVSNRINDLILRFFRPDS